MANEGQNTVMFTNESSIRVGEIESGNINEQVRNINRKDASIETTSTNMKGEANNDGQFQDIDQWVSSLEKIIQNVPQYTCNPGHPGRISRIPHNLRDVDIKGYEPYILSIGPYHHGQPRVRQLEMRKKLVLKCVLNNRPELTLKHYLREIVSIAPTARSFYSDFQMENESFVHMLLLDSVYLLTMFCGFAKRQETIEPPNTRTGSINYKDMDEGEKHKKEGKGTGDETGSEKLKLTVTTDELNDSGKNGENWYWNWFAHDLFLLENQLPFFVLQKMYDLAYCGSEAHLIDITKDGVVHMLSNYTNLDSRKVKARTEDVHHLLHLCHMFLQPTIQQQPIACHFAEGGQMFRLGSAMQLYEAGVHFEARSCSSEYSLLDISFDSSGKMAMPCLHVDDNTESLLRNLIALEQMKYPCLGLNFSAYVVLLLHLVTTPKDVELLRRKEIIQHHLSSDKEMMYLVNRLSTGLAFDYVEDQYSLKNVFQKLKQYSDCRVPRWQAWLKHRHFGNPWTFISLFVASLLLLLTFVQTFFAVFSYYYPYYNDDFRST